MSSTLRNSQLEVLIDNNEWHKVNVSLEETFIVFTPIGDGFVDQFGQVPGGLPEAAAASGVWNAEKRFVRIIKREGEGIGISIQGGAEAGRPIVISKIFSGMPADQTHSLFVGDVILAVNGESMANTKHEEAVRALKQAGKVVNLQGELIFTIFSVQYRRDLHLRRENILHRLSWDDTTTTTTPSIIPSDRLSTTNIIQESHQNSRRIFALKLAFVTRTPLVPNEEDFEGRIIEIRSHSARHVLTLRCANSLEADAWFEAIHTCVEALLTQALAQVNLILGQNPQVRRMGWLAEQSPSDCGRWRAVFVALTINDLLIYDSVPAIKQEWARPMIMRPLIATRVVQTTARSFPVIAGLSDVISFTTRTGTQEGIRTHLFRVETHRELASWVKTMIQNTYEACESTLQVSAPCIWQERRCELTIHLERGLSLNDSAGGQLHWEYPFEAIRVTGDDGRQFLWIEFIGEGGEQELDLLGSPKAVVFILHTFLATKVYQLGLYA
uniref:PDZ domain-containing protein n=1 Tax=Meloidogyne hapla TaxID=6305 RepID=A0A1I8BRX7_MELHA